MSPRRVRFIDEYLKDRNGKQAAIRAGYSPASAESQASRMLKDPEVEKRVGELVAKASKRSLLTVERVQEEIARIAFADPRNLVNEAGQLRALHELDADTAAVVASIEVEDLFEGKGEAREHVGTLRKVKTWDKTKALDMAGRHLGMFKVEVDVRVGIGILVIHE